MRRTALRLRVDARGGLEVIDPGFDILPLLRELDPAFALRSAPLPGFVRPRFQRLRSAAVTVPAATLAGMEEDELWVWHDRGMAALHRSAPDRGGVPQGQASLLDVKRALARRLAAPCRLCARRCGVDRIHGETGVCGLAMDARVAEHFVHVAEEAPVNPSLVLNLRGCGLRCRYCQQHALLPASGMGDLLEAALWSRLDVDGARSISFVGGNPDESLPAILDFLDHAPADWSLPVVWNSHAYAGAEVLRLLAGVVDAYLPDLKYFDARCGGRLSGVRDYPATALAALQAMLAQEVPVIARILVLPGHTACCHRPLLQHLADLNHPCLLVSIRGQYAPDWRVTARDGELARRPTADEVENLVALADRLGLRRV